MSVCPFGGENVITRSRCRVWLVLTPDEIYYSVDKSHESKKTRIKLSECFEPIESSPCVFEIRTKKTMTATGKYIFHLKIKENL